MHVVCDVTVSMKHWVL